MLIFGANGGIGQSLVEHFKSFGTEVLTSDLKNSDYDIDTTNMHDVENVIHSANSDVVVNCVGINKTTPIGFSSKEWMGIIEVNLLSWYNILCGIKKYASSDNHYIAIAIGSNSAMVQRTNSSAYCVSKAAMLSLTQNAAREFGKNKIPIYPIQIDPGFVYPTPMSEQIFQERQTNLESVLSRVPYQKAISLNDIAQTVEFLSKNGKPFAGQSVRFDYIES